jgi:hypothetical protein
MDETENRDPLAAIVYRDPTVSILFGVALFLIVLILAAGAVFAATRHVELLAGSLVLTGLFAIAGIGFGLVRSLRGKHAIRRRRA